MTIFNGAFQHADVFHRTWTIIASTSIVITAVYTPPDWFARYSMELAPTSTIWR